MSESTFIHDGGQIARKVGEIRPVTNDVPQGWKTAVDFVGNYETDVGTLYLDEPDGRRLLAALQAQHPERRKADRRK